MIPGDMVSWISPGDDLDKGSSYCPGLLVSKETKSETPGAWVMWPDIGIRWSPEKQLKIANGQNGEEKEDNQQI
jgi:hypothetical protein